MIILLDGCASLPEVNKHPAYCDKIRACHFWEQFRMVDTMKPANFSQGRISNGQDLRSLTNYKLVEEAKLMQIATLKPSHDAPMDRSKVWNPVFTI